MWRTGHVQKAGRLACGKVMIEREEAGGRREIVMREERKERETEEEGEEGRARERKGGMESRKEPGRETSGTGMRSSV